MNKLAFIFFICFASSSCLKPTNELPDFYYNYYPITLDTWVEYDVIDIVHTSLGSDTLNYFLKERKTNTFYEFGGKLIYTFEQLLKMLLEVKDIKRVLLPLSPQLMKIPAFFLQILPKPPFTVDQMKLLANDNILVNDLPGLEDLGIQPRDLKSELIRIYKNK